MEKHLISLLVVESDRQGSLELPSILEQARHTQFNLTYVSQFDGAVRHLLSNRYDAVLLDYQLGTYSGTDFLKHAQMVGSDTPIILVATGDATLLSEDDLSLAAALRQLGAADVIFRQELTPALLERSIRHAIEQRKSQRQITQLLKKDALTGLGNRLIFEEHAQLAIERARRNGTNLAVMFVDLDRFKNINDTLGHHIGDLLLTLLGKRLESALRKSDVIARIGGDEFTILLDNIDVEAIDILAHKVLHIVSRPAELETHTLEMVASVGIAIYPQHGSSVMELMQKADMALHECKSQQNCSYQVFTDELERQLQHSLSLEQAILRGLEQHEFALHYQPQIHMPTGKLIGVEALIRWPQADGSMLMPGDFIPDAVRNGLIVPISLWVLQEACRQQTSWARQGLDICVSVNISPKHLRHPDFEQQVIEVLNDYDVQPGGLELELTEEAFVEAGMTTSFALQSLRQRGVRIAIDDFGTGYSSMRYLKVLPIDRIKIDRGFISGQRGNPCISDPTITQAVIFLATGLGMEIMAEGIETTQQADELVAQGCELGQGYFYAKPMNSDQLRELLVEHLVAW